MDYNYNDFKDDYSEEEDYYDREDNLAFMHTLCVADAGNAEYQYILGIMYGNGGRGVKVDIGKAEYWFKRAASGGDTRAQCSLADILNERGEASTAFGLYLKAAESGNYYAQTRVGVAYFKGQGVERNIPEAKRWLEEGVKGGYPEARYYLELCSENDG